jgi:hypothetical protein
LGSIDSTLSQGQEPELFSLATSLGLKQAKFLAIGLEVWGKLEILRLFWCLIEYLFSPTPDARKDFE